MERMRPKNRAPAWSRWRQPSSRATQGVRPTLSIGAGGGNVGAAASEHDTSAFHLGHLN